MNSYGQYLDFSCLDAGSWILGQYARQCTHFRLLRTFVKLNECCQRPLSDPVLPALPWSHNSSLIGGPNTPGGGAAYRHKISKYSNILIPKSYTAALHHTRPYFFASNDLLIIFYIWRQKIGYSRLRSVFRSFFHDNNIFSFVFEISPNNRR